MVKIEHHCGSWHAHITDHVRACVFTVGSRYHWYFLNVGRWQIDWTRDDWAPLNVRQGWTPDDRHRILGGYLRIHHYPNN